MKCLTTKLEKKPASSQIFGDGEDLLVGTYQLNSDTNSVSSYAGELFLIRTEDLTVRCSLDLGAGIFRFILDNDKCVLALTDGRLVIVKYKNENLFSTAQFQVCSQMLLDCSILNDRILSTNTQGQIFLVNVEDGSFVSNCGHKSKYGLEECEVWCCSWINGQTFATGAEDGILKIWDLRCSFSSREQQKIEHSAGVTSLYKLNDDYQIMSGSYDDNLRLFDWRNLNKPLSTLKLNGGIWEVSPIENNYFILACMYGGASIIQKSTNSTLKLVHSRQSNNPTDLCYSAKAIPIKENEEDEINLKIFTCFFNDYSVRKELIKIKRNF
uniref:methylated diphthine methylhydrolase n=1 Tax=Meloidogyne enterolobii TaxID=390850 RepID=A0A6V7XMS6_MELEN|nr:unnamed protein product [Meloidogyne enterolobii]